MQALLAMNAPALAAAGVHVPKTGRPLRLLRDSNAGHHNLAWELNRDPRFDPAAGTLQALLAELDAYKQPLAVLSSEDFEYLHCRPDALERLHEALLGIGYTPQIISYFRPRAEYARSLYVELRKHGLAATWNDYVQTILRDGEFRHGAWVFQFRYGRLLRAFAEQFGSHNVFARAYRRAADPTDLLLDFMRIVADAGAAIAPAELRLPGRLNQTVDAESVTGDDDARLTSGFSDDDDVLARRFDVDLNRAYARRPRRVFGAVG